MSNCTYKYFDKSSKPPPFLPLEKFAKISLLETARRPDRKFSRRLFPTKARKNNNTGFRQSEKKKKREKNVPTPWRNQRIEKLVSRDPVPETCFHRCNVPCRVKKCDFSNNLRIRSRNTGTKRVRRRDTIQFIPPSFRTYTPHQTKAGRGELTRPRYLI